jgi:hypothetical protein
MNDTPKQTTTEVYRGKCRANGPAAIHDANVADRAPLSGAPRDRVARETLAEVCSCVREAGGDRGSGLRGLAGTGHSRRRRRAGPHRDIRPIAFAVSRMLRRPAICCSIVASVPVILLRAERGECPAGAASGVLADLV